MHENIPLITTLATAFGLALILGVIAVRLKLPALAGYLLAGILIGPFTPGFIANGPIAGELAEIGVMLLMFGVGLHFSIADLMSVRRIALPGALLQITVATLLGAGCAIVWGWGIGGAIVFGLSLSVASTVVLLRALEARATLESMDGRISVGWLVVEDLIMVLVLVLLPPLSGWLGGNTPHGSDANLWQTLGLTLVKVAAFITLMLVVGSRVFPKILWLVARTGSRELFTLCVVATAVSIAFGAAKLFGVSFALGAFFAGMMMRESEFSHRAAEESLPLREAFSVLFFVSVGMLFDPMILLNHPYQVLTVIAIIILGKSLAAALLVMIFRYPLRTALNVSASLAQIGEFSFILAALGVSLGLLPVAGQSLILAGALISIAINPLIFFLTDSLQTRYKLAEKVSLTVQPLDPLAQLPPDIALNGLSAHIVLVGYGRVGRRIGMALTAQQLPYLIIEQNRELCASLREQGILALFGDATDAVTLAKAHIESARMLVIAIPDTFSIRQLMQHAHTLNAQLQTVARIHDDEEAALLNQDYASKVFIGEDELAKNMSRYVEENYR